jgi:putative endoribonuclease L-PSP
VLDRGGYASETFFRRIACVYADIFAILYLCLLTKHNGKTMKAIHTTQAPAAIGPYSQAIEVNGFVFASGQLPIDPATGEFAPGGIKEQTRQSLTNAARILEEAGTDLFHVVKTTVFLSDMADFAAMNEVYATFFREPFPARSAVAVKALPKGALVEIECIAGK